MTKPIAARSIQAAADELVAVLPDRDVRLWWEDCSPRLARVTPEERREAELSPGGYGIHWPLIDEDLSVGGLMRQGENGGK